MGKPEELMATLGVVPGVVSPYALLNAEVGSITVVVDNALFDGGAVGFHPGRNTATLIISPEDFMNFLMKMKQEIKVVDFEKDILMEL